MRGGVETSNAANTGEASKINRVGNGRWATVITDELVRRKSSTQKLLEYLIARPLLWISWRDLARACDSPLAWRTRIADCRRIVKRDGADIVWNNNNRESCYRYVPYTPLARSAETPISQKALF